MKFSYPKYALAVALLASTSQLFAQYSTGFQVEYFYGNLPGAKIEAMGMADAAIGGTVASSFFNSAGLGGIENQEVYLSTSAPFYILRNSNYTYAGYAKRINSKMVAALSLHNFDINKTTFEVNIGPDDYPVTKGLTSNYALSLAVTPIKGLYVGLNFNLFRWKLFEDVNAGATFHIDGGALYNLELPEQENIRHHAQFGMSINNFTKSKIRWEAPDGNSATNELPMIGRYAAAYFVGKDVNIPVAGYGPLDFTFTMEYQNTFNSDYFNTFSLGMESLFWNVFAFRLGYFTQSQDDRGQSVNYNRIKDITYGFGTIIPLNELTDNKFPISVHLDYVALKPPSTSGLGGRTPNMRTFTLRAVWTLENKSVFEIN
jgi:hypothetical protein